MAILEFSGNPEELKDKIEAAVATYELFDSKPVGDFEIWFEDWENGFVAALDNRSLGNYQLTGEKKWRTDTSHRPRWREWGRRKGIITGEYWPDREKEEESLPLSGTTEQLINYIVQIEIEIHYNNGFSFQGKGGDGSSLIGQPRIKLHFRDRDKGKAVISLRVVNKTDDTKIPLPLIDKSDLRQYANRIKQEFAEPNLYVWQKGREIISYKNRFQGFDGQWWLVRNERVGRDLLQKLVNILQFPLDTSKIRKSIAPEEGLAFPPNPPDEIVLGEKVKGIEKRPLVDVTFWRAEIKLAKIKTPIPLVERGLVVYE